MAHALDLTSSTSISTSSVRAVAARPLRHAAAADVARKHASAIAVVCHSESSMWSTSSRAGPRRARIRSGPDQQADPLQVAFLAKLAQRHVGLLLKVFREVGSTPPAIQIGPERCFGAELMECACERVGDSAPPVWVGITAE